MNKLKKNISLGQTVRNFIITSVTNLLKNLSTNMIILNNKNCKTISQLKSFINFPKTICFFF